jgi:hypothetical protein
VYHQHARASEIVDSNKPWHVRKDNKQKEFPTTPERDPGRWAHKRFVPLAGKANQMPMFEARLLTESTLSLAISFDCDHYTAGSCAVGLKLPTTTVCSAAVVSCFLLLSLQYHHN